MLIENIIRKLKGNPDYKWESNYTLRDLFVITATRLHQVMRGGWHKLFLKRSAGLFFVGYNVKLKHAYQVSAGRNFIVDDNVYINALSSNGIVIGDNVSIARDCTLICTGIVSQKGVGISIGNNTGINAGTYLAGQGGIEIGEHVIIGPGVKVFSENHNFSDSGKAIKDQGVARSKVTIQSNCWIGANTAILAGVNIGEGCVIAAGSIVTKSVPANSVAAGVPARVIKSRTDFDRENSLRAV
ncbi:acyltransferase [Mucilaginibacter pallidiroseus]|uniref:Acyltransferase n=1 Tax=Mucilaginibacter pallidiroseus TaxID=2599295 RepID=A0A563U0S0_9SPHI|nr:acyltransferase [Mucilaginibacter pallidiroseus]TWR25206.1 acyltransferase [Mucilaginibacter pallidiroseus]